MQDIGGCRAIVSNVPNVKKVVQAYHESRHKHKLNHVDDYIADPPVSGYRGVHLIYKYVSDKNKTYNDLKIEIQIRSQLQHAWATAVETVGTFINQALKSSRGEENWLRFFALMGSALADRERTKLVPGTPSNRKELFSELKRAASGLDVSNRLRAYGSALQTLSTAREKAHYFLLHLDPEANQIEISGFKYNELNLASEKYLDMERKIRGRPGADAVLVSVDSLDSLRRAYPNYFLDTEVFLSALETALK
jgi:hypothetical protein